MEIEFYRKIFEKYPNIKFDENPFSVSTAVSCERTDGQTDRYKQANSRVSQFYERA